MSQGGTAQLIPGVGTIQQIKAGLGFGPKRAESSADIQVDQIAGLVNTFAEPQGVRLNRLTREWADFVDLIDAGVQGLPLAEALISMAATQGIQITLNQLSQLAPTPAQSNLFFDATGTLAPVIPTPSFTTAQPIATRASAPVGARGLGFTTPSGFPILPPRTSTSPTSAARGGFNFARFIQCLLGSISPTQRGGTPMPFITTPGFAPSTGSFDFGGFGGILQSGLNLASSIFSKPQAPAQRFPELQTAGFPLLGFGGALTKARQLAPALGAGFGGSALENLIFGSGGASDLDETASFTDPIPGRCRPKAHVKTNPCTGKGVWFVPRGRPLVFSGDMSACKRVDRVAKRLDKARPKRRHHHHTKRRPR